MDNGDRMIDDWLSGEECDPTDYDLYEINQYKRFMGLEDDEEDDNDSYDNRPDPFDTDDDSEE